MKKHVHKYKRVDIGRKNPYLVYRCVQPGCSHYIPVELIIGKFCICWSCSEVFTVKLSDKAMPRCDNCREIRGVDTDKLVDALEITAKSEVNEIGGLIREMELPKLVNN